MSSVARFERTALLAALAVSIGSAIGGVLRMLVGDGAHALALPHPWATAFANITGSLAIGLAARWTMTGRRPVVHRFWHPFLLTGVCGGYTTFSILSAETVALVHCGRPAIAMVNIIGSLLISVLAAWLGLRSAPQRPA